MTATHLTILGSLAGLFALFLTLIAAALSLWAVVDAVRRPDVDWVAHGSPSGKFLWVGLVVGGWLLCGVAGPVVAVYYLLAVRPALDLIQAGRENVNMAGGAGDQ